jgi:hypothetical protein
MKIKLLLIALAAFCLSAGSLPMMGVGPGAGAGGGGTPACTLGAAIANNTTATINGLSYTAQNANQSWSLKPWSCNNGYRFETRNGDHWQFDAVDVQHNEWSGNSHYNPNVEIWCSWAKRIVTAPLPSALYHTSPQGHHSGNTGNPPWSINYTQSRDFNVYQRTSAGGPSGTLTVAYDGVVDQYADNVWHYYVVHLRFNQPQNNTGIHEFWVDSTKRVDKCPGCVGGTTNIGYQTDHTYTYWKWGDYHGNSTGTVIHDYANMECQTGTIAQVTIDDRINNPLAVSIP